MRSEQAGASSAEGCKDEKEKNRRGTTCERINGSVDCLAR